MNILAEELNKTIQNSSPAVYNMLSDMGKALFFPKGILSQSAEAKVKADKINATIGIAKEKGSVLSLPSITRYIPEMDPDQYLPYAPSYGIPELRKVWKESVFAKNPTLEGKPISLPVVTSGITHGVSCFSDLWVNAGDTLILPDMMWGNYNMTFCVRNHAKVIHYPAYDEHLTRFNVEAFEHTLNQAAANTNKIVTVLNFPHNPSGYSLTREEGEQVARILIHLAQKGTHLVVACDDAYFGLFYEEETLKESLFSLLTGAHERIVTVKLDGATKEDYVWGFRTGFITYGITIDRGSESEYAGVYEALEKKTAGCIRGNISNASHLSQSILLKSMKDEQYGDYKAEKFDLLKERCAEMKRVLEDPKYNDGFDVYPFNSGYFMCIRIKDVDAESLRVHLLENYGTGLISIGKSNIRIAFSCLEKEDVRTLFDIILQGINDLRKS
ncbi:MAG: aminotransferase class I/II-fold pyridoxal phosphate-dependent enzyme [Desulfobacteraceae bacterium]|nr:MAG: aminotransferase class I/II-fold pyridoxal phosphate-dependent enzyme [Desulfobacteraceae bacterium]